jgi:DNA-binding MarR family transcriptional regulator
MGELAERVVYSPSRLTYLVTNLSRDGWVEKVPSASDGRGFDAVLTDAGIDTVLNATELHQQTVRDYLLDDMTDADIDQIVRIFGALDRRLKLGGE